MTQRGRPTTLTRGRRWRWNRPPTVPCERAGRSQASGGIQRRPGAVGLVVGNSGWLSALGLGEAPRTEGATLSVPGPHRVAGPA